VRPFAGDFVPRQIAADGLIVLGGKMSTADDALLSWLEDIRALLRDAVAQAVPTLGICLGAQLLAQASGGKVTEGGRGFESGLISVTTSAASNDDALFEGLGHRFPAASMHKDAIVELPPGSVLLGSTDEYPNQAFRVDSCAWGVQFHPEIAPDTYASWADNFRHPDPEQAARVSQGVERLAAADAGVVEVSISLAERFSVLVKESAAVELNRVKL
jgi:GMP synthase (glutamine-hydrolysing)